MTAAAAAVQPATGVKCPLCSCPTKVYESRTRLNRTTRRRRCLSADCRHQFKTTEMLEADAWALARAALPLVA